MNPTSTGRASVAAAILVGAGALLSSLISFLFLLWNAPSTVRMYVLQDPLGWALRPRIQPMAVVAMLLAFVVLVGFTWFFVRLIVRAALPRRGAAVFFGTWGAVTVSALIAGLVRAPLLLSTFGVPAEQTEILVTQFHQIATSTASWGLTWGWLAALIVALVHRASAAPVGGQGGFVTPAAYPYAPQASATQYPPATGSAAPLPPHGY